MESVRVKDPKDGKIINKDDSVTNKDGNDDLEKGGLPTGQSKTDNEEIATVTPGNDNSELYEPATESSNKGQGPSGENL
ncbi:MAG: hypothetical protein JWP37_7 [Mucilaginibacter sp.]|nr:hypothetical protein [Mucilaginibacter sp.]